MAKFGTWKQDGKCDRRWRQEQRRPTTIKFPFMAMLSWKSWIILQIRDLYLKNGPAFLTIKGCLRRWDQDNYRLLATTPDELGPRTRDEWWSCCCCRRWPRRRFAAGRWRNMWCTGCSWWSGLDRKWYGPSAYQSAELPSAVSPLPDVKVALKKN